MKKTLRIVMAQLNFTVGDLEGNLQKHIEAAHTARDQMHADMIVFPELSMTAYPPEDLLLRKSFIEDTNAAVARLAAETRGIYCLVGHPYFSNEKLRNGCSLLYDGKVIASYAKERLPNYAVFDEVRYFTPGKKSCVVKIHDFPVGILICEDLWSPTPLQKALKSGAKLIIAINASPFVVDKHERRHKMLVDHVIKNKVPIIYTASVGGQDELIFDGDSMAFNADGELCYAGGFFKEALVPVELALEHGKAVMVPDLNNFPDQVSEEEKIYNALVLGLRDYINKNHIAGVLIGISGGIDSALTLAIAVDALGKDRVRAALLPSRFTSELSMQEAKAVTQNFAVQTEIISIEPAYKSFLESLARNFAGKKADVTEENIQSRCRAVILMALSNKTGYMVLNTGNRSETAVGYCTIYGDMAGGYAVLKDVYKTQVYALARYRNQINRVIPEPTLTRAPTAELAPGQKDEDSLPPYSVLDPILIAYLDDGMSIEQIVQSGFDRDVVLKIVKLIHQSEYKRRQGAIGPRVHRKSFGKAWRYPITNGYKG